ncbi:MAG: ribonuclease HII [Acidimicrobiales bacterium]|nr:MAG: ribonuclease HII [Acidimicrobiales bacterium]
MHGKPDDSYDLYVLERRLRCRGFEHVAGADEAGRGACAGPLVAAAVVLPPRGARRLKGLTDSKLLSPLRRERLYEQILLHAHSYAVVVVSAAEVDATGVHRANLAALRRAVAGLSGPVDYALTDGFSVRGMTVPTLGIWKGDQVSACVAAASVVAKVTRDHMMCRLGDSFPAYDFSRHKGYITTSHSVALREHGPCSQHRWSFTNVKEAATQWRASQLGSSFRTSPGAASAHSRPWATMTAEVRQ